LGRFSEITADFTIDNIIDIHKILTAAIFVHGNYYNFDMSVVVANQYGIKTAARNTTPLC